MLKKLFCVILLAIPLFFENNYAKNDAKGAPIAETHSAWPMDYTFFLAAVDDVSPDTLFSSYTNGVVASSEDSGFSVLKTIRSMLPMHARYTNTWAHLAKNPKISLNALSRSLKRDFLAQDLWPMATFIENQRKEGVLNVSLPFFVPISLYLAGGEIALNGDCKIAEELVVGVDFKRTHYLASGMRNEYTDAIMPTTVVIKGHVAAYTSSMLGTRLMVDKGVSFDLGPDAVTKGLHLGRLKLYDSHIETTEIINPPQGDITFFGDCSIDCQTTSTLNGRIGMTERYAYSISDPSSAPNDTVVVLRNINVQPAFIDYRFYPMKDKGYFKVDGEVDLSNTLVKVQSVSVKSLELNLGKRILFIESTGPIKGQPIIQDDVEDMSGVAGSKHYHFSFEKEGNKAYLIVTKNGDDSSKNKKSKT